MGLLKHFAYGWLKKKSFFVNFFFVNLEFSKNIDKNSSLFY